MVRTTLLVGLIATVAAVWFGREPCHAATASEPSPGTGAESAAEALLRDNDRAIAENKRLSDMLNRHQQEDFGKYERLRRACEGEAHGTLADSAAPAVAHCIETAW